MRVTLSQLRVLEAVIRNGSMSKAAEDLGIRQPSASTQIRALESGSRSKLLDRRGHDIEPSRLGRLILPKVRAVTNLVAEIERTLEEEASLESGVLRVGYSAYQYAMPVVSRFISAHPGVKIEALSMASVNLLDLLARGEIDVAFVTGQGPAEGLEAMELVRTEVVLAIPVEHPLAERGTVDWAEIGEIPILRREAASGTRIIFDAAAERAGVELDLKLDLGSWGSLRSAVESGIGACVALLEEIEERDRVAVLRIRDGSLWASHRLVCSPQMREVASVDAFFAITGEIYGVSETV